MSIHIIKHFGEINTETLDEYYDCDIEFNEKEISLDLNFNIQQEVAESRVHLVNKFLDNLNSENEGILKLLKQDFKSNGFTKEYCDIIIDTFEEEIEELIENTNKKLSKAKRVLSLLHLRRIGFYLDNNEERLIICDYTVDKEKTDELLVVGLDSNLDICYLTIES